MNLVSILIKHKKNVAIKQNNKLSTLLVNNIILKATSSSRNNIFVRLK